MDFAQLNQNDSLYYTSLERGINCRLATFVCVKGYTVVHLVILIQFLFVDSLLKRINKIKANLLGIRSQYRIF